MALFYTLSQENLNIVSFHGDQQYEKFRENSKTVFDWPKFKCLIRAYWWENRPKLNKRIDTIIRHYRVPKFRIPPLI